MKTKEKHQLLRLMGRILLVTFIYQTLVQSSPNVTLSYHAEDVYSLAFDSGHGYLASGSAGNKIVIWRKVEDSWSFNQLLDNGNPVNALVKLPDSRLASSSLNNILIWTLNTKEPPSTLTGHTSSVLGNLKLLILSY